MWFRWQRWRSLSTIFIAIGESLSQKYNEVGKESNIGFYLQAQHVSPLLPMTILGSVSVLTGISQYYLPETINIQTPNSIEDAKRIWE